MWCCGHHSCLSSWEARVQALVGPLLRVLKFLRRKGCLYNDISNGKPFASSRIRTLNRRYLGSPVNWAIACWINPLTRVSKLLNRLSHSRLGDISFVALVTISYFVPRSLHSLLTTYDIVPRAIKLISPRN